MSNILVIQNFGNDVDASDLEDLFATVGDVESAVVEMKTSRSGSQLRVGYVQMSTVESARHCIERFHGQTKNGLSMVVTSDQPHVPDPNFKKNKKLAAAAAKARA